MTETKECTNCGKWMIKWRDNPIVYWACAFGHREFSNLSKTPKDPEFTTAWQEANKEKK